MVEKVEVPKSIRKSSTDPIIEEAIELLLELKRLVDILEPGKGNTNITVCQFHEIFINRFWSLIKFEFPAIFTYQKLGRNLSLLSGQGVKYLNWSKFAAEAWLHLLSNVHLCHSHPPDLRGKNDY